MMKVAYLQDTHAPIPTLPAHLPLLAVSVCLSPPSLPACAWFQSNTDGSPSLWSRVWGRLLVRPDCAVWWSWCWGPSIFAFPGRRRVDDRIVRRALLAMR